MSSRTYTLRSRTVPPTTRDAKKNNEADDASSDREADYNAGFEEELEEELGEERKEERKEELGEAREPDPYADEYPRTAHPRLDAELVDAQTDAAAAWAYASRRGYDVHEATFLHGPSGADVVRPCGCTRGWDHDASGDFDYGWTMG